MASREGSDATCRRACPSIVQIRVSQVRNVRLLGFVRGAAALQGSTSRCKSNWRPACWPAGRPRARPASLRCERPGQPCSLTISRARSVFPMSTPRIVHGLFDIEDGRVVTVGWARAGDPLIHFGHVQQLRCKRLVHRSGIDRPRPVSRELSDRPLTIRAQRRLAVRSGAAASAGRGGGPLATRVCVPSRRARSSARCRSSRSAQARRLVVLTRRCGACLCRAGRDRVRRSSRVPTSVGGARFVGRAGETDQRPVVALPIPSGRW